MGLYLPVVSFMLILTHISKNLFSPDRVLQSFPLIQGHCILYLLWLGPYLLQQIRYCNLNLIFFCQEFCQWNVSPALCQSKLAQAFQAVLTKTIQYHSCSVVKADLNEINYEFSSKTAVQAHTLESQGSLRNDKWPILLMHEFCDMIIFLLNVFLLTIHYRQHDFIVNLVFNLWQPMQIGMIRLINLCSNQIVHSL